MSRRPTLAAVAEAAGVSSATVDRVLNSRLPVREATALRVIKAAERIGYHAAGLMRERLRERATVRRLGFCLQKRKDPFYQAFGEAISAAAARHGPETAVAVLDYMDALEPAAIAAQLLALGRKVDALAVVAVDHPHVTAAIDTLHAEGRPVFTLLSDLSAPQRAAYVGVDNRQTGRTAAWAITRLARGTGAGGEVAVFVGSHRYLGQEISEISFRSHLREHAPQLHVLDTLVNLEDAQLAHEATLELLARHPDLVGIYVVGGGVAGIIRALREESAPGRIVTVCNELSGDHRTALIDGVVDLVLRTPIERIGEAAVRAMVRSFEPGGAPPAGTMLIQPFELFTPENV